MKWIKEFNYIKKKIFNKKNKWMNIIQMSHVKILNQMLINNKIVI
jgi:hypothetical protein